MNLIVGQIVTITQDHYPYNQSEPLRLRRGEQVEVLPLVSYNPALGSVSIDGSVYVKRANGEIQRTNIECIQALGDQLI